MKNIDDDPRGGRQAQQKQGGPDVVAALPLGEQHQYGSALMVTNGVQLLSLGIWWRKCSRIRTVSVFWLLSTA